MNGRLENWEYNPINNTLHGDVCDDSTHRFPEGHRIQTSRLVSSVDELKEGKEVKTKNSVYLLGKPAVYTGQGGNQ